MEIVITHKAKEDILFWKKSGNTTIQHKISKLIESSLTDAFSGLGKPEPLKHELSGTWSRRINKEHRLVYEVVEDRIIILSAKRTLSLNIFTHHWHKPHILVFAFTESISLSSNPEPRRY